MIDFFNRVVYYSNSKFKMCLCSQRIHSGISEVLKSSGKNADSEESKTLIKRRQHSQFMMCTRLTCYCYLFSNCTMLRLQTMRKMERTKTLLTTSLGER